MRGGFVPGDVVRVRYGDVDQIGLVRPRKEALGRLEVVYVSGGFDSVESFDGSEIRPLVVIDPEDREQVERLAARFHNEEFVGERRVIEGGYTDAMQAALRSLTAEPKFDEPQGLGAVVEAIHDTHYVHLGDGLWQRVGTALAEPCAYATIAVAKVLSEGVTL